MIDRKPASRYKHLQLNNKAGMQRCTFGSLGARERANTCYIPTCYIMRIDTCLP